MTLKRDLSGSCIDKKSKVRKESSEENLSDTSMTGLDSQMNLSNYSDNTMHDIDEETVKHGTSHRLKPVKILINDEVIERYRNSYLIKNEIIKNFNEKLT